jgi:hypothetical protein
MPTRSLHELGLSAHLPDFFPSHAQPYDIFFHQLTSGLYFNEFKICMGLDPMFHSDRDREDIPSFNISQHSVQR